MLTTSTPMPTPQMDVGLVFQQWRMGLVTPVVMTSLAKQSHAKQIVSTLLQTPQTGVRLAVQEQLIELVTPTTRYLRDRYLQCLPIQFCGYCLLRRRAERWFGAGVHLVSAFCRGHHNMFVSCCLTLWLFSSGVWDPCRMH
jgi:hypothetical protein